MTTIHKNKKRALFLLILAAIVFFILRYLPFGNFIQWPFVIITTFIHEMGHGLTALALGGELMKIEIYSDASGAAWTKTIPGWRQAAIAAGGLLAPSLAGGVFILSGRKTSSSSITFLCLGAFMLISALLWVRSSIGLGAILLLGMLFIVLSRKTSRGFQQFVIQFIGVHMLVDTFTRTLNYAFTRSTTVAGQVRHSDTSVIAEHMIAGHLFWASVIILCSMSVLFLSLKRSYFD